MRSIDSICRMANDGWLQAGEVALEWYEVAMEEHLAVSKAYGVDFVDLVAYSALASYNASPAMQSGIVARWLDEGAGLPLPNSQVGWRDWVRYGRTALSTSKAECYRVAMMEGSRSDAVVLDRHMLRALGNLSYSSEPRGVNEDYNRATDRCLAAARRLGVSGCQLQALVWYGVTGYGGPGQEGLIDITSRLGGCDAIA